MQRARCGGSLAASWLMIVVLCLIAAGCGSDEADSSPNLDKTIRDLQRPAVTPFQKNPFDGDGAGPTIIGELGEDETGTRSGLLEGSDALELGRGGLSADYTPGSAAIGIGAIDDNTFGSDFSSQDLLPLDDIQQSDSLLP